MSKKHFKFYRVAWKRFAGHALAGVIANAPHSVAEPGAPEPGAPERAKIAAAHADAMLEEYLSRFPGAPE